MNWIPLLAIPILVPLVARQVRRPTRWLGRPFLWMMNLEHSAVTEWALASLPLAEARAILDVGCGGGRTIARLAAAAPEARVTGADLSRESGAVARAVNRRAIAAGRVGIVQAPVSRLPFADAAFDLVTACETHYYWPDLDADLAEVRRVTRPGGTVAVVAETYRGDGLGRLLAPAMRLIGARHLTADEHREWFERAGLAEVEVTVRPERGWLRVTGRRPG